MVVIYPNPSYGTLKLTQLAIGIAIFFTETAGDAPLDAKLARPFGRGDAPPEWDFRNLKKKKQVIQ